MSIVCILLPIVFGALIPIIGFKSRRSREIYTMAVVLATSVLAIGMILNKDYELLTVFQLTSKFSVSFRLDGLGSVFAMLVSALWPFATLYAFEYMDGEERCNTFFGFYTISFGVSLGIAFANNMITLYLFYELLTIVTLPLIMHKHDSSSFAAGWKYLIYSIGGATLSFIGIILFDVNGGSMIFLRGGGWNGLPTPQFFAAFLFCFFGFGVKAAIFPLHGWLPTAGIAPTPVTALLHAVAVVKTGCFAIIRVAYYSFGMKNLHGSRAADIALCFVIFTIVYGSTMAYKETHLKRRLAYSTISNLSYILFGALLFTPEGLTGSLLHLLFHGVMKIPLFFVVGILNVRAQKYYSTELEGIGLRMPKTFAAFTVASLALTGVPPLCGFVSKFALAEAAVAEATPLAYAGIAALLISAVLTAAYLLNMLIDAFFPAADYDAAAVKDAKDPNWYMVLPIVVFAIAIIVLGLKSGLVINFVSVL